MANVLTGNHKYICLELKKDKTLYLRYGGLSNIEYNKENNEITLDVDLLTELIDSIMKQENEKENILIF